MQRRTTYEEIATATQAPTEPCNIHGEPRTRLAHDLPAAEFPRASLAVDLSEVAPVIMKAPVLLAEKDPYNSAKPSLKAQSEADKTPEKQAGSENKIDNGTSARPATNQVPESSAIPKAIPKAIAIKPEEKEEEQPVEIRKAVPVGPLDEIKDGTLLQTATPPPTDLDHQ